MDDLYNISILDDIETTINQGNEMVNPFNMLDVISIKFDLGFIGVFDKIDLENLYNETIDFDIENYQYLISNVLIDEDNKENILRFTWWICRELIYGPEGKHNINIIDLLKDQSKNYYIKIFVYAMNDSYRIGINLPDQSSMIIKFKNNDTLI